MSYKGERLEKCHLSFFNKKIWNVVIVSSMFPNPCGHALLNFGGVGGYFAHIEWEGVIPFERPFFLDQKGFDRYMKDNNKLELYRHNVFVPNPEASFKKLEELLTKKWAWGGIVHNCVTFIEDVLSAGGAKFSMKVDCPVHLIRENPLKNTEWSPYKVNT